MAAVIMSLERAGEPRAGTHRKHKAGAQCGVPSRPSGTPVHSLTEAGAQGGSAKGTQTGGTVPAELGTSVLAETGVHREHTAEVHWEHIGSSLGVRRRRGGGSVNFEASGRSGAFFCLSSPVREVSLF
jgi:hypothetical protein